MIQGYKKILVGIDGSVESANAFDKAVAVAIRNDAELLLVNVIDLRAFQSISTYDTMVADDTKRGADQLIADFADEARAAGVTRIKTIVEFGSPKVMMATTIPTEEQVDLVMIGATGLSYIERLFIGSVAQYIVTHAKCDTLIIR
ncbi:MAG: universal stress protein [Lactococcus sp.]|jgi:nucleotide-binding universal stress UspA family protein|uniref:Universal stress protein UspA n=4 Tax=Pseudolactococcus TaxID=3436058 RepID=A0A7L4WI48_9LACT|nr:MULTISPECIES: universal stress protein [Lactococcus]MBR6895917.1 universal stress protein [Lactococcus sp.]MCJ1969098.1 universal stress protein [Lactococcus carnosus]MCJ1971490.1 universal stress protein [Lactococcus carnosus]MCJ1973641.1 universal stress protein [Lactococcus carnosus]MCJ1974996.1 universal stress protein [Lactococcus carnosus]